MLRPVRRRSHGAASWRPGRVGRCDCRPGGGRRTLFAGAVISPSVGRRATRYTRLPAGRGARRTLIAGGVFSPSVGRLAARSAQLLAGRGARRTLFAGGVFALYGGRRAAAVSESVVWRPAGRRDFRAGHRAGHHPHGLLAVSNRGWPQFATYRPGPVGRATSSTHLGPGAVHCPVGPMAVSPPCRRCSRSGRRDPAARQVWGTDSDTSWRRRGRRSWPEPRAAGAAGLDFPRTRSDVTDPRAGRGCQSA